MLSKQARGSLAHGAAIQPLVHMPGPMQIKRRGRCPIEDEVLVGPAARVAPHTRSVVAIRYAHCEEVFGCNLARSFLVVYT